MSSLRTLIVWVLWTDARKKKKEKSAGGEEDVETEAEIATIPTSRAATSPQRYLANADAALVMP